MYAGGMEPCARRAAHLQGMKGERNTMRRPIGVILLAAGAGLLALVQIYRMFVYLGILEFPIRRGRRTVSFETAQWGAALWALIMAAIWGWVAAGFWNLRAYAVQFGIFISLFTLIWGFFALLFGSTYEAGPSPGCSPARSSCTSRTRASRRRSTTTRSRSSRPSRLPRWTRWPPPTLRPAPSRRRAWGRPTRRPSTPRTRTGRRAERASGPSSSLPSRSARRPEQGPVARST